MNGLELKRHGRKLLRWKPMKLLKNVKPTLIPTSISNQFGEKQQNIRIEVEAASKNGFIHASGKKLLSQVASCDSIKYSINNGNTTQGNLLPLFQDQSKVHS